MVDSDDVENASGAAAEWADRFEQRYTEEKGGSGPPWFKIGLAMLGPTIALFGIMSGVLLNFKSESDARKSEAAAREREEQLRQNELAVPIYQDVATAWTEVDYAFAECEDDLFAWVDTAADSPEEAAAETAIEKSCDEGVGRAVRTLQANLEQALIVSNSDLRGPAEVYRTALTEWEEAFKNYSNLESDHCDEEPTDADYAACQEAGLDWFSESEEILRTARLALQQAVRDQVFSPTLTDS
jgi:hypothetical protein